MLSESEVPGVIAIRHWIICYSTQIGKGFAKSAGFLVFHFLHPPGALKRGNRPVNTSVFRLRTRTSVPGSPPVPGTKDYRP